MKLEPFDYRDPGELIAEVARTRPLVDGDALLVLVENPSTEQRIVCIEKLPVGSRIDHYLAVRHLLCDTVRRLPLPDLRPPRHSIMTVLVRPGFAVFGHNEGNWLYGWRYSNHLGSTYNSDITLVTEHGWVDFSTDWGGHYPRMVGGDATE